MDNDAFVNYIAKLYALKPGNDLVTGAVNMGVASFCSARPWTFTKAEVTLTTDSDGIVEFPDDFDGVISMRERDSSSGGWIHAWPEEKFDYEVPRLDNLSGSYPKVCKLYNDNNTMRGQMAPPVDSMVIYVTYKRRINTLSEISDKFIPGLLVYIHAVIQKPGDPGYMAAQEAVDLWVKKLWKQDRKVWARIFREFDDADLRRFIPWWGVWNW